MPILNMIAQGGGGGGNIGEPLNLTVTTSGLDATITWEDNEIGTIPPTTFQKSELVRKIGSAPTSPSDGDLVVTETVKDTYKVSGYVDSGLTDGTTYYYRVFSYSDLGGISYCDAVSVTVSNQWQPGANTIAYYELNGDATDATGNYDGTASNVTYTTLASGIDVGTFNGSNAKIDISNPLISSSLSDWTISFWGTVNNNTFFGNVLNNQTSDYNGIFIDHIDGHIRMGIGGGSILDYNITPSTWCNLVITFSSGTIIGYANGTYLGTASSQTVNNGTNMTIGCRGNKSDRRWNGNVSKVIFEDKCWSASEISDYYDQTKGDYGIS